MVKMTGMYTGEKHCEVTHEPSKSNLQTDAPRDNQGRGEKFSPTDLVGAALGSCILTTLAIVTEKDGVDLKNSLFTVEKEMTSDPRRISALTVTLNLPKNIPQSYREKVAHVANNCPVKKSLHPDLSATVEIHYNL